MKIKKEHLNEIKQREAMIREQNLITSSLELSKSVYIRRLLDDMGFDKNKNYNIDLKDGKIIDAEHKES